MLSNYLEKFRSLGEWMKNHIANIITGCRILGSGLLLLFPVLSVGFYIIYIICGFTDMIDGTIARKTNSASKLGEKLDTMADLVFVTISLIKILQIINIPMWVLIWGMVIAVIKLAISYLDIFIKKNLYPYIQ